MTKSLPPIRVVIADDHPIVRTGLRLMLQTIQDIALIGEAIDGETAVQLVGDLQPQVVLMDLRMPRMDGIAAIARIRRMWPQIAIIILTTYDDDELMIRGLQAGAAGYLLKDTDLEVLFTAIRTVARGERLLQPDVLGRILTHAAHAVSGQDTPSQRGELKLTSREREILAGVAQGERSKEIAVRLGLSERTVRSYLETIYMKLGVDSRASAVAVAIERGLLSLT